MSYLKSGLISLGIGSGFLVAGNPISKSDFHKPNVIFILADDLGYGDLSCMDNLNLILQILTGWLPQVSDLRVTIRVVQFALHHVVP